MNKPLDRKALDAAILTFCDLTVKHGRGYELIALEAGIKAYLKATQAGESEPFGYWVKHRLRDDGALLQTPAYIPKADENTTVTPLYAAPPSFTAAQAKNERLREALEKIERVPAWGFPDKWEPTPAQVRQIARAALAGQELS